MIEVEGLEWRHSARCMVHPPHHTTHHTRPTHPPTENDNDKMQEEDTQSDKGGEDGQLYEAQFRGRFLKGVRTSCPKGTVGFVVRESPLPAELVDKAPSTANNRYVRVSMG